MRASIHDQQAVKAMGRLYDNQMPPEEPEHEEPPEPLGGNDLYLWLQETVDVKRLERGE